MIVSGDFNDTPESEVIRVLRYNNKMGLTSTKGFEAPTLFVQLEKKKLVLQLDYTFFEKEKLDILADLRDVPKEAYEKYSLPNQFNPSDHLPLYTIF